MAEIQGSPTGAFEPLFDLVIDTGSLGNPSPKGQNVTGKLVPYATSPNSRIYHLAYGQAVSGPSSVTVPANATQVTFTVTTNGSGTDAHVQTTGTATDIKVAAHVSGQTVIWGS